MKRSLITDVKQVDPAWLTTILQKESCLERGHVTQVRKTAVYPSNSSTIAHLEVDYSADASNSTPTHLVLKLTNSAFASCAQNEAKFYNLVAPIMASSPLVRCYDTVYAPQTEQSHLLLNDLSLTHYQPDESRPLTKFQAKQAVDCLAKIHAFWWEHPQLGKIGVLPNEKIIKGYIQIITKNLAGFLDFLGDKLSADKRQLYEHTLSSLSDLFLHHKPERLTRGQHITLTHGDAHPRAFFYPHDTHRDPLYIIDWAIWSARLGPSDLAYMMGLYWHPEQRRTLEDRLLRYYYRCLLKYGVKNYEWEDCWFDYRLSAIRNLFLPVWRWPETTPADVWWLHWERTLLAFEDLKPAEFLSI